MAGIVERLTEGIVNRDMRSEGHALLNKWQRTGLLEGLGSSRAQHGMARLLENQAKELLRESSTMSGGDVEGFAAVAFPIVRRVFAGLIANDLVSVQPMSLPSGLIFFLDFTTSTNGAGLPRLGYGSSEESLFGGGVVGSGLTGGVDLTGDNAEAGPYALNNGYASATGSTTGGAFINMPVVASGAVNSVASDYPELSTKDQATLDGLCSYDPDLSGTMVVVVEQTGSSAGNFEQLDINNLVAVQLGSGVGGDVTSNLKLVRRLTRISSGSTGQTPGNANWKMSLVFAQKSGSTPFDNGLNGIMSTVSASTSDIDLTYAIDDKFSTSTALGSLVGASTWGLEAEPNIPEIDIKVDSVAVTAMTKKLKAKWTPELGQDLNAYHNLDAEVELTSILSEQIALEIDREILEDLITLATAGTYYWSRSLLHLTSLVQSVSGTKHLLRQSTMFPPRSTERLFVVVLTLLSVDPRLPTSLSLLLVSVLV